MLIILWICMCLTVYIFQLITLEIISLTNGVCNLVLGTLKSCLGYKLESKSLMTDSKSVWFSMAFSRHRIILDVITCIYKLWQNIKSLSETSLHKIRNSFMSVLNIFYENWMKTNHFMQQQKGYIDGKSICWLCDCIFPIGLNIFGSKYKS